MEGALGVAPLKSADSSVDLCVGAVAAGGRYMKPACWLWAQ